MDVTGWLHDAEVNAISHGQFLMCERIDWLSKTYAKTNFGFWATVAAVLNIQGGDRPSNVPGVLEFRIKTRTFHCVVVTGLSLIGYPSSNPVTLVIRH